MNNGSIVEAVVQHLIALGRVAKNRYINYLLYFTFFTASLFVTKHRIADVRTFWICRGSWCGESRRGNSEAGWWSPSEMRPDREVPGTMTPSWTYVVRCYPTWHKSFHHTQV